MTQIKILSVDMRGKDREIIQAELQEQVDKMNDEGMEVIGPIYPLPSPNTAIQYFVATCKGASGELKVSSVKEIREIKEEGSDPKEEFTPDLDPIPEWRPDSSDFVN